MVWGAISVKGLVGYHALKCIMDGAYYVRILEDHLISNVRKPFARRWRLQPDNDPKHQNRLAKDFMNKKVPELLDLPSNSPDVNPIENLCSTIRRRVEKQNRKISMNWIVFYTKNGKRSIFPRLIIW